MIIIIMMVRMRTMRTITIHKQTVNQTPVYQCTCNIMIRRIRRRMMMMNEESIESKANGEREAKVQGVPYKTLTKEEEEARSVCCRWLAPPQFQAHASPIPAP
jgi:hypothetical protein